MMVAGDYIYGFGAHGTFIWTNDSRYMQLDGWYSAHNVHNTKEGETDAHQPCAVPTYGVGQISRSHTVPLDGLRNMSQTLWCHLLDVAGGPKL